MEKDRPPLPGRAPWILVAAGLLLLAVCSDPAADLWIGLWGPPPSLGPATAEPAGPWAEALIDPQALPWLIGAWLGTVLAVTGLCLWALRRYAPKAVSAPTPVVAQAVAAGVRRALRTATAQRAKVPRPQEKAPITLPPLPSEDTLVRTEAAGSTPKATGVEAVWYEASPSVLAQGIRPEEPAPARTRSAVAPAAFQLPSRYRLETRLGDGALGVVYLAWDETLQRSVAVKVVDETLLRSTDTSWRFVAEARTMAGVGHPNLVTLLEAGLESETPYLVLEYLRGRRLDDLDDANRGLPEREALGYGIQVAGALAAVHERHLVHRDVTPWNIVLLEGTALVKLMDFGLAHVFSSGPNAGGRPAARLRYRAPEQILGSPPGPWTDIYGLGATLFTLLTGAPPFPGEDPRNDIVHSEAPDPRLRAPGLWPGTAALILSCLAKDPAQRPQSAAALAAGLQSLAALDPAGEAGGSAVGS